MPKLDVVSLAINDADIHFEKCLANLIKIKSGPDGGVKYSGNITIFFGSAEDATVVTPYIGQRISIKFATASETFECMADGHENVSFDGRPAFYILI